MATPRFYLQEKISNKELLISEKTDEYLYLKKYFEDENLNSLEKFVELLSNNHPPKIFRDLNLLDSNIFLKYDEVKNKFNNIRFKPNENIVDLSHINKRISQTDEYLAPIIVEMSKKGLEVLESCAGNHPFSNGFHCCNYFSPQESFFIIKREYTEEEKYFLSKFKDFYISYERIEYYDYDIALIASCLPNRDKNSYFDYMKMCILNDEFLNKLYTYIKEAL